MLWDPEADEYKQSKCLQTLSKYSLISESFSLTKKIRKIKIQHGNSGRMGSFHPTISWSCSRQDERITFELFTQAFFIFFSLTTSYKQPYYNKTSFFLYIPLCFLMFVAKKSVKNTLEKKKFLLIVYWLKKGDKKSRRRKTFMF